MIYAMKEEVATATGGAANTLEVSKGAANATQRLGPGAK